LDFTPNKIETIYFTNNNIGGKTVEQNLQNSKNPTDSVLNTSFDFLQVFTIYICIIKTLKLSKKFLKKIIFISGFST